MDRALPAREFLYDGTLPNSETAITGSVYKVYIGEVILTNITGSQVTVTLKTNEASPVTKAVIVIEGNDQWTGNYANGWDFTNGIRVACSAASAVSAQIYGKQQNG